MEKKDYDYHLTINSQRMKICCSLFTVTSFDLKW